MERYFLDPEDEEVVLKDIDDNWNVDMDLAIEKAVIDHNCTHRQILQTLPLDKYIDYLIHCKILPDINRLEFLDDNFNEEWLDGSGSIDPELIKRLN